MDSVIIVQEPLRNSLPVYVGTIGASVVTEYPSRAGILQYRVAGGHLLAFKDDPVIPDPANRIAFLFMKDDSFMEIELQVVKDQNEKWQF
jgi:hypothetical protein